MAAFFGLVVSPGKQYTRTVDESFNVTMAALSADAKTGARATVILAVEKTEHVLCTLTAGKVDQQRLDIKLTEGEEITIKVSGTETVHLTGYIFDAQEDDDVEGYPDFDDSDEGSEDEDDAAGGNDDETEDDDSDGSEVAAEAGKIEELDSDGDSDGSEESEGEDDDSEDDSETEEEVAVGKKGKRVATKAEASQSSKRAKIAAAVAEAGNLGRKLAKAESATLAKEANDQAAKEDALKMAYAAKKEAAAAKAVADTTAAAEKLRTAAATKPKPAAAQPRKGGVLVEELQEGTGPVATKGKRIGMYYRGWLASGKKKQFDACLKGKPFDFRLGAGEVIKGWDIGVEGMRVGGKRRLTIPAAVGYGRSGAPPDIPPNATLMFDVECKSAK